MLTLQHWGSKLREKWPRNHPTFSGTEFLTYQVIFPTDLHQWLGRCVCCGQMASVPQLVSAIMVGTHLMTELTLKIMKNNAFVEGKVWRTFLIIWFLHVKYSGFLQFVPQFWSLTAKPMIQNFRCLSTCYITLSSFYPAEFSSPTWNLKLTLGPHVAGG